MILAGELLNDKKAIDALTENIICKADVIIYVMKGWFARKEAAGNIGRLYRIIAGMDEDKGLMDFIDLLLNSPIKEVLGDSNGGFVLRKIRAACLRSRFKNGMEKFFASSSLENKRQELMNLLFDSLVKFNFRQFKRISGRLEDMGVEVIYIRGCEFKWWRRILWNKWFIPQYLDTKSVEFKKAIYAFCKNRASDWAIAYYLAENIYMHSGWGHGVVVLRSVSERGLRIEREITAYNIGPYIIPLPFALKKYWSSSKKPRKLVLKKGWSGKGTAGIGLFSANVFAKRSEERRVGKECRSRWSPYH